MRKLLAALLCLIAIPASALVSIVNDAPQHGAGAYVGPIDAAGHTAYVCVSVRACSAAYATALGKGWQLTRTSDSTQCDVVFKATGNLDTTTANCTGNTETIVQFCDPAGGNSCLVSTGYDQSGASRDQGYLIGSHDFPTFNASCVNGRYCVTTIAGNNVGYGNSGVFTVAAPWSTSMVASRDASSSFEATLGSVDSLLYLGYSNAADTARVANTADITAAATDGAFHSVIGIVSGASSVLTVDGSDMPGNAGSTGPLAIGLCLWGSGAGCTGNPFIGKFAEGIIWSSTSLSGGERSALKANQAAYFGTP